MSGRWKRHVVVGEEVGVAGGDQAVEREPARVAVVGVEPVALPGVVGEDHVGLQIARIQ